VEDQIKSLREQVKKGNISSAMALAEALKWGYYGTVDPRGAARMYRICCRSKDQKTAALGYYHLGVLYYYGHLSQGTVGEEEIRKAFQCFLKSAMTYATPSALARLGDMYRYGQYVEKNEKIALSLYVKANR